LGTFLAILAGFVVLLEGGIAGLVRELGRLYDWRRRRRVCGLAEVDAGISLALSDEGGGSLVGDDLEVVWVTSVEEIDGRRGPLAKDDGPLLLSHGNVLGVVVPIVAEGIELSLEFVGDGRDEGVVGIWEIVTVAEEGESRAADEIVDLAPDTRSDGGLLRHGVEIRGSGKVL